MRKGSDYPKIVEWSTEDRCFVGSCPGLFYGGCHGDDEKKVFTDLCKLVEKTIELYQTEGRALPPPLPIGDGSSHRGIVEIISE